jgi:hypothetical protein
MIEIIFPTTVRTAEWEDLGYVEICLKAFTRETKVCFYSAARVAEEMNGTLRLTGRWTERMRTLENSGPPLGV